MKTPKYSKSFLLLAGVLPLVTHAQNKSIESMHQVLKEVQISMLPLCEDLIQIATAIGGFGALFYIGIRVIKHIANAEPVDFFPLFRPFVLTILIGMFPVVLEVIDVVLSPITVTTDKMVTNTRQSVDILLGERAKSIASGNDAELIGMGDIKNGNYNPYILTPQSNPISNPMSFMFGMKMLSNSFSFLIKLLVSTILQMVYYAASICIDVMRTFQLVILSILGPLVFALSIYDGFQHTLSVWLGRYINVYMWLPIANLFGAMINKIQAALLQIDVDQLGTGSTMVFSQTDAAYIIFLVVAIVGYFSVPSIANYVIHASGGNAMMGRVNQIAGTAAQIVSGGTTSAMSMLTNSAAKPQAQTGGGGGMASDKPHDDRKSQPMSDAANSEPYRNDANNFQANKLG